MAVMSPERARREMVRLVHRGLGVREFSRAAARVLRQSVPFDGVCVLTMDPATLLPTGEVVENGLPAGATARLTELEFREPDFNKFDALARVGPPVASLSAATRGRLDQSRRQRELRGPNGFDDELRAVLVSDSQAWGALSLLREHGRRHFTQADVRRVTALAAPLAEGIRRALLLGERAVSDQAAVGLLLLAGDNSIVQANQDAGEMLEELRHEGRGRYQLPIVIEAVASRARSAATGEARDERIARARIRTRAGRWLVAHASVLGDSPAARVAVVVEPAHAAELAPLIAAAYGLTERERKVTQLVAQGLSTADIARRLHQSPWTVQDHLKAIFTKTDTGTRGELVARIFFDHYAARLSG